MGHNVLKPCFPMIGFDLHGEISVTPPWNPAPSFPHVCFSVLNGIVMKRDKTSKTTQDGGNMIIRRTSDIGNLIPHVPIPPMPNLVLLPLVIGFSGSKSYFGPASVQAEGKVIGCALIFVVDLNGNCWDILSAGIGLVAPTGVVITWNTVETSLTFGDILGGFITMAIDAACTAALSFLGGKLAGRLSGPIVRRIMGSRVGGYLMSKAALFAKPLVESVVESTIGGVLLFVTGSPLGHSLPGLLGSDVDAGSAGNTWGYDLGNAITGDSPGNGSAQDAVGTSDGNVPSASEQAAQRDALQQPVSDGSPAPGQPGGDLANQPVETW
ncbi:MAG: hypothetical protein AAGF11_17300 [Myxococcota bacterium]